MVIYRNNVILFIYERNFDIGEKPRGRRFIMPKKVKKASKKRGGSSSQQADYSLMFASDFTDFKPETFQSSPSNNRLDCHPPARPPRV